MAANTVESVHGFCHSQRHTPRSLGTVNVRQATAKTAGPVVGTRSDSLLEVVTERVEVSRTHDGHDIAPYSDVRESVGHVAFARLGPRA